MEPTTPITPEKNPVSEEHSQALSTEGDATTSQVPTALPWRTLFAGLLGMGVGIIIGSLYLTMNALPDHPFYPAKVTLFEPAITFTKFNDSSRIAYETRRIETRLEELQYLLQNSSNISPETSITLGTYIEAHATHLAEAITNSSLPLTDRIEALSHADVALRAAERITEEVPETASTTEAIERGRDEIARVRKATLESLAQSDDVAAINAYISSLIVRIGERLILVSPGSEAERIARARIFDAEEAIKDNDLGHALSSLLRADEAIDLDQYLYDSERGEVPLSEHAGPTTTEGQ